MIFKSSDPETVLLFLTKVEIIMLVSFFFFSFTDCRFAGTNTVHSVCDQVSSRGLHM